MKIKSVEALHCDAGWRPWTFIKITTDAGLTGYSECTDSHGSPRGLEGVVRDLQGLLVGEDPRAVERCYWKMYRATRQTVGGLIQKAIGGIENALLDIKAKELNVPVYSLLGGPILDELRVYWSHCGTTRVRAADLVGERPVRNLDDVAALGREVVARGFTALKTNLLILEDTPYVHMPGFGKGLAQPDRNVSRSLIDHAVAVIGTMRDAVGGAVDICLDLNFNFRVEGVRQLARELEPFNPMWLEVDSYEPGALNEIRRSTPIPICSGENLYGLRDYRPFFERQAMETAVIDVPWNGLLQSKKIADLAESCEIGVAPHNYYSHLATFISAHFCAVIPNTRIMEIDVDDVPWKDELFSAKPHVEAGLLKLPDGPGWGGDLNEEVIAAHPWPR